eukprot:8856102-Prorocentrum_lima.AAC.1
MVRLTRVCGAPGSGRRNGGVGDGQGKGPEEPNVGEQQDAWDAWPNSDWGSRTWNNGSDHAQQ